MFEYESPTMLRFWTDDSGNSFLIEFHLIYPRLLNDTLTLIISQGDKPPGKWGIHVENQNEVLITLKINTIPKPQYPTPEEMWEYGYEYKLKPFFFNVTEAFINVNQVQYILLAISTIQTTMIFALFVWGWRKRG